MTTPGYPDYARLSRSGGFLLYGVNNVTPAYDTALFQGYVGLWPYLNLAMSVGAGSDTVEIVINYYSDQTFTNIVGFRNIIRQSGQFSVTQYANLSEWAQLFYVSHSGNPVPFSFIAMYGSTGPANQFQLTSMDVPLFQFDGSLATGTSQQIAMQHVQPGPATLVVFTTAATWNVQLWYWDYGSNQFLRTLDLDNTIIAKGGVFQVAMLDTPAQITVHNSDASTQTFRVSLMSTT